MEGGFYASLARGKNLGLCHAERLAVVCVKFSKLVMVRVRWFIQVTRAASLCSIGNDHPFVPTCPPAERRAQRQSRMPPRTRRHRRSRRAASLTERARC